MKLILLSICMVLLFGCGYSVEQDVHESAVYEGRYNLRTFVVYNGKPIKGWFDNIETIDDSTKIKRRMEAEKLIINLTK